SDFSTVELSRFKLKNRHFWNMGEKYYRVDYLIKVALGPADIRFELWFNGQKLSKDEPIRVEWQAATAPTSPPPAPIGNTNANNPMYMQQQVSMSPLNQHQNQHQHHNQNQNWDVKGGQGQNVDYNQAARNRSSYAVY
ncbi:hypothetical protein IFR05_014374, partial [Cadophora sp. M221]